MDIFTTLYGNLALGFGEALTLSNMWYCLLGVFLGCMVGVLPGLGSLIAISLLLPITFHIPTSGALMMLAGVYFGSDYGGGTSSILLGVPGHAAAAVDVLDGYPMTQQGRGGIALFMKCVASFFGATVGILLLALLAPALASVALKFGPGEYAALLLLGLIASATVGQGSPLKGIAVMLVGILIGTIGLDISSGLPRFTFGISELEDGVNLAVLALGLFAITELVKSCGQGRKKVAEQKFGLRDQLPTREDWRRSVGPMLRGSGLGATFGALPGTSGGLATFLAYSIEKRISRNPERFGKGAIEGIAAPEACNNAGIGGAFIPTLTLGIPGDPIMALLLGAMMMQGIVPGPQVVTEYPDLFWGLIASFWIGNVLLVILNIPLIGLWVRILAIPYSLLFPAIVMFTCIGAYSVHNNVFDVLVLSICGLIGYLMLQLRFEAIPLLLGFILGPSLEENFTRSMTIYRGDFTTYFERPITASILLVTLALVVWTFWMASRKPSRPQEA
ncbi:tripartite tricarboxylate transporter permease [Celeribacter naphthalenivorans]|uniref:tripartite tricarboxylate transporter permease n=1 Tax=Celeribacter naphthalenivorans TaxID=1614694 RepID=UPI001CFA9389|nr:tripartite tricarboxylate transporter permease [Celeribacter naphthalenivorans]